MELSLSKTETIKKTKSTKTKNPKSEEIQQKSEHVHIDENILEKEENSIIEKVLHNDMEEILDQKKELSEKDDSSEKDDYSEKNDSSDKNNSLQKDDSSEKDDYSEKNDSSDKNNSLQKDDSSEKEEYLKKLDIIVEAFSFINEKNIKDFNLTKDFFSNVSSKHKKINKSNTQLTTNLMDIMLKENLVSLKNKDLKQSKPKKVINKENLAINKLIITYPEVLKFLKFEDNAMVSRAQLIQNINAFVKKEKTDNNPDIYVKGDNRCFNLIGELKVLFDFIKLKMLERGDLENESEFPSNISYRQIMKYLKYCFHEIKK